MRIISGKYRSKRIVVPKNIKARPTTDFAKESLFNVLSNEVDFDEIEVLDLFAGTGNISYEFLSRGAAKVVAVDIALASFKFITKMSAELDGNLRSIKYDVFKFIKTPRGSFDIVFADPPYAMEGIEKIPHLIRDSSYLKNGGTLIVEHGKETDLSKIDGFKQIRNYGRVNFSFFEFDEEQ